MLNPSCVVGKGGESSCYMVCDPGGYELNLGGSCRKARRQIGREPSPRGFFGNERGRAHTDEALE